MDEIWELEDYEDGKVDIWLSDNLELNIDLVDSDLIEKEKFFDCCINFDIGLVRLEPSYMFLIRDCKSQFADNRLFCKITLEDLERQDETEAAAEENLNQFIEALKQAKEDKK